MTDFNKIKNYYKYFNEKDRLITDNSGKLEYEMTMRILNKYLPKEAKILDLGGAAGAYSFPLAEMGYEVYLADLSEGYYPTSKEIKKLFNNCNFEKIDIKSIRGIGYEKENDIYNIIDTRMFDKILELIESTSSKNEIIEMGGHAMYIGKKVEKY